MRYATQTTLSPAAVLQLAREHCVARGLREGLQTINGVEFDSPVGSLRIEAHAKNRRVTDVVVIARELDDDARAFLFRLPRQGVLDRLLERIRS